jgi:transmembrane sensor
MFEKEFNIAIIISQLQQGELNVSQQQRLDQWLAEDPANEQLFAALFDQAIIQEKLAQFNKANEERGWAQVVAAITQTEPKQQTAKLWPKIVAVAAIVAIVFGIWIFNGHNQTSSTAHYGGDVAPGKYGASITLSSGEVIRLKGNETRLLNGESLKYAKDHVLTIPGGSIKYLVASTAKGQTYQLVLADGTKVWLNADAKLTFPSKFEHNRRAVTLSGEGYFEVSKDTKRPFIVESLGQKVEVLGTHFNINAYPDESLVNTTLLEGVVRVSLLGKKQSVRLVPGEQAHSSQYQLNKNAVSTAEVVAWKDGYFRFNDEPIESVMRKLSRWYNIEVTYEGKPTQERLNGRISRNKNISQVLNALEDTKAVHFKIVQGDAFGKGRRIIVMQ